MPALGGTSAAPRVTGVNPRTRRLVTLGVLFGLVALVLIAAAVQQVRQH